MSLASTPKEIDESVADFCKEVVKDSLPYYVNVVPEPWSEANECFHNVAKKVESEGGNIIYGWQVWLWPEVFIEAEFHAIWQSPSGECIDITPKQCQSDNILFIPDSKMTYQGADVDNIRNKLSPNKLIDDFITLAKCRFQLVSGGKNGKKKEVSVPEHELNTLTQLHQMVFQMLKEEKTQNAMCLCNSGSKYKHCHKKNVLQLSKYYGVAI